MIKSVRPLRAEFWRQYPEWKRKYYTTRKTQNDYPCDIRLAWCEYIEGMHRNEVISDALVNSATL